MTTLTDPADRLRDLRQHLRVFEDEQRHLADVARESDPQPAAVTERLAEVTRAIEATATEIAALEATAA
jgi:hypothetical protein